jgi:hypothetical protein
MVARRGLPGPAGLSDTSDGDLLRARGFEIGPSPIQILTRNPRRIEAFIFNAGGNLELPADLGAGLRTGVNLPAQQFIDSGSVAAAAYAPSTYKSFVLIVDQTLTWVGAIQPTVQLIVGRAPWAPSAGGASGVGGSQNNFLKGAVANLGPAAATSLAVGIWPFSPVDLPDLQWQFAFVGLELKFGGALTAGQARLVLVMPGGPPVLLGTDEQISANTGDRANSFVLLPSAPYLRLTTRRAIFAATIAGNADLRIWESVQVQDRGTENDLKASS